MKLRANLVLLFITLLWGLAFPLIKLAIVHISADAFVLFRFLLASLCLLPLMLFDLHRTTPKILLAGLCLGLLNAVLFLSLTIALKTISAPRTAFITGTNVLIIPFLLTLFHMSRLHLIDIACATLSLLGLYVLTAAGVQTFSIGDLWALLSAFSYALTIIYVQQISLKMRHYRLLTFYQIIFTIPWAAITGRAHYTDLLYPSVIIALLFSGIGATAIAFYLQLKYQRYTTATQAAIIYCLEPVFATLGAFFITRDPIAIQTLIGGSLILMSLLISTLFH